jgi:hypothetical protein
VGVFLEVKKIVSNDGVTLALVVKKQHVQTMNFVTEENFPLQLGINRYSKGSKIRPHVHNRIKRVIDLSQEMVYLEKGRAKVCFYDERGKEVGCEILQSGDLVFFVSGGHGFDILAETKIIEVKQGPFHGTEKEKKFLDCV